MTDDPPWPEPRVRYSQTIAIDIASKCNFEQLETYRENVDYYKSKNYSYIPMPADGKYYDVDADSLRDLCDEHWVWLENPVIPEFERLEDHGFLLTFDPKQWFRVGESGIEVISPRRKSSSEHSVYHNPHELVTDWPEYSKEMYEILRDIEGIYIITLADLNDRRLRAVLYQLIASVEVILSHAIEDVYPTGEDLIQYMSEPSIGRWKKAEYNAGQLHPSEYMQFGELKHIASQSPEITNNLGYDGKGDFNQKLGGAKDLRNQVMHPTKNLIGNQDDVRELNRTIEMLEEFIIRSGGTIDRKL